MLSEFLFLISSFTTYSVTFNLIGDSLRLKGLLTTQYDYTRVFGVR